ncbi:MAG TPA: beta-ketoacyl-ACP synthase II [Candidatus Avidesulfovibrio excrementigallinarum]|nr:beta-ketoacyl-ACP synthase II [Candidatus Avidesulfovibrio excrementigallinarum]
MERKRVVVTGYSAITPLANSASESWEALLAGKSGIAPITLFDTTGFDATIAGEVKNFNAEDFGVPAKQLKRMDRFTQLGLAAALELVKQSGLTINDENAYRIGTILGVGLGGLHTIEVFHTKLMESGPSRVSPFMIPMLISNMAPGHISIFTGCKGANMVLTSACASATHAIGYACSELMLGRYDAMITGGVEATITPMGISGFTALKALCTAHNDDPTHASCPFDKNRSGFIMGEGTGLILVETLESALRRGATIYAEVVGFGASADAYHMTAPEESGEGMAMAMRNALADAGVAPEEIGHINAHGTSTQLNDLCETRALKKVFGKHAYDLAITASKSQIGHLLGAAGGVQAVFSVLSLYTGMFPGTINLTTPDPECDLNYMADGSKQLNPEYILSNSFGFGGTNGSVLFKKYNA